MSDFSDLFKFAAKVGSLEGYLFKRDKLEPLTNWTDNVQNMYHGLTAGMKKEISGDLAVVLQTILEYGDRTLEADIKAKLQKLYKEVKEEK
ncbi:MAG: hypothetical protein U1D67_01920 [Dehalococcoidia bacterium]|nr:hypothetical protein [Dehalococcoidia bacterium]MDZ4245855.1 hypothetical protein [Dehalococcoidia bacterium]